MKSHYYENKEYSFSSSETTKILNLKKYIDFIIKQKINFFSKIFFSISGKMSFIVNDDKHKQRQQRADLIIGCDGAFSSVRRAMVKLIRFDYSQ